MKHTWKKTVAFVLAMTLVAGAMPANVGGFLTGGTAIVAHAEDYTLSPSKSDGTYENDYGKITCWVEDGFLFHYTVTPKSGYRFAKWTYYNEMEEQTLTSTGKTLDIESWEHDNLTAYFSPVTSIANATVNLAENNTVLSLTVGDKTITDLTDFVITYGTDDSHTETEIPNELGTYYAYVSASDSSMNYDGATKSEAFEVTELTNKAHETLDTNKKISEYIGNNIKITVTDTGDKDGFTVNQRGSMYGTISAMYGATIDKIVVVRGYYNGTPIVDSPTATRSANGSTFTFTNINASSVKLTCTGSTYAQIKQVTVYFSGDFIVTEKFNATPAGCFTEGNSEYVTATDGKYYTVDNGELTEIEEGKWVIPEIGHHTYGTPVWDWNGTESATATFNCEYGDDTQVVTAEVTSETSAATFFTDGYTVFTAKATFDGKEYTDTNESLKTQSPLNQFNSSTETNPTLTLTEDLTGDVEITRDDGVIDLNGHTITGNLMLQNNDPDKAVTVKNGTITGDLDSVALWNDFFKGKVILENVTVGSTIWTDGHDYTIKSGTYNGAVYALKNAETTGNITITGGTFNNIIGSGFTGSGQNVAGGTFSITGGTFASEPDAAFIADGYTAYHKGDIWSVSETVPYEKVDAVAATFDENGNTEYYIGSDGKYYVLDGNEYVEIVEGSWIQPSMLNRFNSTEETNPVLTLTEDVDGDVLITRDDGVFDLNGHTINGNLFAQNNDPNKTLTIKNGVIDEFDPAYGFDMFFVGDIVFENVTVNDNIWTDGHSITINSGTYYNINCFKQSASESIAFTINGGTFNGKFTNGGTKMYHDHSGNTYDVADNGKYDVTVTGGTFSFDPTEYVAEDCIVKNDGDLWTVAGKTDISAVTINYTNGNTFTQTGSDIDFAFTLTDLAEGTDYEVFEGDKTASQPGTYMVKVRGLGSYKGEMTIPWYIVPAAVTIKVNGTAVDGYEFGKSFTVTADAAPAGQKFSHWAVNNEPICYSEEYSFIVKDSVDLTAVYVEDTAVVEAQPVLTLGEIQTVYNGKNAIGFEFTHTTPDSYTIEEVGLLYATNKLAGADTSNPAYANTINLETTDFGVEEKIKNNTSGKVKKFVADYTNHNGTISFSYAIGNNTDCYVYAIGYIKAKNANNEEVILYTDFTAVTYNTIN